MQNRSDKQHNAIIKPKKRPNKVVYSFGPVNTLTGPRSTKDAQKDEPKKAEKDSDEIEVAHTNSNPILLAFEPSSDDSFEGIRWKTSPRRVLRRDGLPSSPLANVSSDPWRSPTLKRAISDVSSRQTSPKNELIRTKSSGLEHLLGKKKLEKVPSLSNWIDRFEGRKEKKMCTGVAQGDSSGHESANGYTQSTNSASSEQSLSNNGGTGGMSNSVTGNGGSNSVAGNGGPGNGTSSTEYQSNSVITENGQMDVSSDDPFSDDDEVLNALDSLTQTATDKATHKVNKEDKIDVQTDNRENISSLEELKDDLKDESSLGSPNELKVDELELNSGSKKDNSNTVRKEDELDSCMKLSNSDLKPQVNSCSSDPFSDDDEELIMVKSDSSDPFSDDEDVLAAVDTTQPHPLSLIFKSDVQDSRPEKDVDTVKLAYSRPDLIRCVVREVLHKTYGKDKPQMVLRVKKKKKDVKGVEKEKEVKEKEVKVVNDEIEGIEKEDKEDCIIILRGEYTGLGIFENDVIHIIVTHPETPHLVDDKTNLMILNPDILLSATVISQQLACPRRTVLQQRFKFPGVVSLPIVIGEIVHAIFQDVLVTERYSKAYLTSMLDKQIKAYIPSILSVGDMVDHVREEIASKHIPMIERWFTQHMKGAAHKISSGYSGSVNMGIAEVLDIEESIWSPTFGIRGVVDATVEVVLKGEVQDKYTDAGKMFLGSSRSETASGTFLMPLEIKTGMQNVSHHGQASLYALLYKDRYDIDVNQFLLVYTKEMLTQKRDIRMADLRSLVNLRNTLSVYFKEEVRSLPPLLKRAACDTCSVQGPCMVINSLCEDGSAEESGIPVEMYHELTGEIAGNTTYQNFYRYWDTLLVKEEAVSQKTLRHIWTQTAQEREQESGLALGGLVIAASNDVSDMQQVFQYTMERRDGGILPHTQLVRNDRIIVSDERGHFAIARGVVRDVGEKRIVVETSRRVLAELMSGGFSQNNQVFKSVLRTRKEKTERKIQKNGYSNEGRIGDLKHLGRSNKENVKKVKVNDRVEKGNSEKTFTFRIDKDHFSSSMALARFNILNLFVSDSKRRSLVVDNRPPRFSSQPLVPCKLDGQFNPDQTRAIRRVLCAHDYALVLGMPGTGKTTLIAELIRVLVQAQKTVLLASYTHSAVDNILLKIKDKGIGILRVGSVDRVHAEIKQFVPDESQIETHEDFVKAYMTAPVVASTCLATNDIAFALRPRFDYCIVDEASQVSLPVSLGPIALADKFVLVGDHMQLPPLVKSADVRVKKGLSCSLFRYLAERHRYGIAELTYQYRMCSDVMDVANQLVYDGKLKVGTEKIGNRSLEMEVKNGPQWLRNCLRPERKVVFLNYDAVDTHAENSHGKNIDNPLEAEIVYSLLSALEGVGEENVGVISFNRAQLRLLRSKIEPKWPKIEVLTADQYQGRDKDCIIVSLVRSNSGKLTGDLVKEWRRVNVAFTRAKAKLIVVGSRRTLEGAGTMKAFAEMVEERGWMVQITERSEVSC